MREEQEEMLKVIREMNEKTSEQYWEYWTTFSNIGTWQFWLQFLMITIPLLVLFLKVDRRKVVLLGFFGLNYHIWFAYVNVVGIQLGLWEYPYQSIPFLSSFALDAALVPILYMLLYQWSLNRKKNLYIYALILSGILAFIFKPILVWMDLFHMFYFVNYFHLFLFYYAFFFVSKVITNIFLKMQQPPLPTNS